MTKSKHTRKALLASVLSMLLCCAMLIGSTFAWFTDSTSTGVNRIQAGTLDVLLKDTTGNNLEGGTLQFVKAAGHENEELLWEPGVTYSLPPVQVQNNGNLALEYKLVVNGIDGDAKLLEAIEWKVKVGEAAEADLTELTGNLVPGQQSDAIVISGHMKEDAGNEYQGLSIDGIAITVVATQDTVEYDSVNNTYDENAAYPEVKAADTKEGFAAALEGLNTAGEKNVLINVTKDVDAITGIKTASGNDLAVDFGGNTVTVGTPVGSANTVTNGMQLLKGSDVTLKNGTYKPYNDQIKMLVQNYSDLTLKDVTLDASQHSNVEYVLSNNCGYTVITGNTNILAASGMVAFDSCKYASYPIPTVVIDENMTGTINGKIEITGGNLIIKGGTFKNTAMDFETFQSYVADGYTATNTDGVYTVTKAN